MLKTKYLVACISLLLISCQSNKEKLIGHWHSCSYYDTFQAFDFLDTNTLVILIDHSDSAVTCNYTLKEDYLVIECDTAIQLKYKMTDHKLYEVYDTAYYDSLVRIQGYDDFPQRYTKEKIPCKWCERYNY